MHYFKSFEYTREFYSNDETFDKIVKCLNSEAITSDILKRCDLYKKNKNTPIKENEWDTFGFNENVYIKYPIQTRVKIKHFNKDILKLNDDRLFKVLYKFSIENLNIDGLTQYSIVKFSPEIEQYSKKLLKSILSSERYRNSFLKHDQRFNSNNQIKDLLNDIFNGHNSDLIFDEIWENIFFVPFLGKGFSGFNSRDQYSVFINSNPKFNYNLSFQKIIPIYYSQLNILYHEFTHNTSLIIAANLECDELKELLDLQNLYSVKYNQNNKIYDSFDDFGDLMEVELYRIRPRKFKTFSGLFCLECNSYNLESKEFREKCLELCNYDISNMAMANENLNEQNKNGKSNNLKDLLNQLFDSEIAKLLNEYFDFDVNSKNEIFVEDDKPREIAVNCLYNEEISIDIDYCDKLD